MKNKIFGFFGLLAALIGMTGCAMQTEETAPMIVRGEAPAFEDELLYIGMIQTGKESDWRDANTDDYLHNFVEENGFHLIYIDGNSSPERQIKAMYDLIQQQVDYIVIQPIVEDGWEDAVEKANRAGIPVIVADRQIAVDPDCYTTWIGSNFHEEGNKAVLWLENYLEENGRSEEELNIVLLEGTKGATASIGRTEGIMELIEKHDNWHIAASECANFTQGEAQDVMEKILKELPDNSIDVVISENDNMMFGAMKAMDRYGVTYGPNGDIITISFDALREAFEKMMEGKLHATIECNPLLAKNVERVIRELEAGNKVEKQYFTQENVYDYENAYIYVDERVY